MTMQYTEQIEEISQSQINRMQRVIAAVSKRMAIANLESLCFETQPLENDTFDLLINALQGRIQHNRKQKLVAAWVLTRAELTETQRRTACSALGDLVANRKTQNKGIKSILPSVELCTVLGFMIGVPLLVAIASPEAAFAIAIGDVYVGIYPCIALETKMRRDVAAAAQAAIGKIQVRESVDILAGLWMGGYDRVRARSSLDIAFGALTDDDYGRMDSATLPRLLMLLEWYTGPLGRKEWNVDRATGLLTALGKIGDKRAIPAVRKLIRKANEPNATRELAAMVVARLEERERQEEQRGMLLRASSEADRADTLLRPSADSATRDPALLVRAAEADLERVHGQLE